MIRNNEIVTFNMKIKVKIFAQQRSLHSMNWVSIEAVRLFKCDWITIVFVNRIRTHYPPIPRAVASID